MPDAAFLRNLFPGIRITGGARDPRSPLGRANPRSYHNVGRAWDVAPIPGMRFGDFIDRLKGAGVNVLEARDEVNNPSRHATGPHWHFAYGDKAKPRPAQPEPQYNYLAMTPIQNGVDPLAPQAPTQQPFYAPSTPAPPQPGLAQMQQGMPQMPQQPNFAAMSPVGARDPLAPKPKAFGKGGVGWQVLGILGDALRGYAGQAPVFAPAMMEMNEQEREDNRFRERLQAEIERDRIRAEEERNKPQYFNNSAGDRIELGPNGPRVVYADPYGKPQYQRVEDPTTGSIQIVNNGSASRPNENHVRHLLSTGDKRNFDAKFGPGMADYYLRLYSGGQ